MESNFQLTAGNGNQALTLIIQEPNSPYQRAWQPILQEYTPQDMVESLLYIYKTYVNCLCESHALSLTLLRMWSWSRIKAVQDVTQKRLAGAIAIKDTVCNFYIKKIIYTHTHLHTSIYTHIHIHAHTHTPTYTHIHTYIHTYLSKLSLR